jgi:hypothetical protein
LYKDGSEPPNAEADGLDFIRIDKLVSVCKFFTKKKMAVLRALDTMAIFARVARPLVRARRMRDGGLEGDTGRLMVQGLQSR